MKQILLYLGVVLVFIGFHSCSNDFEEISTNNNEAISRASKATGLNSNLASIVSKIILR